MESLSVRTGMEGKEGRKEGKSLRKGVGSAVVGVSMSNVRVLLQGMLTPYAMHSATSIVHAALA